MQISNKSTRLKEIYLALVKLVNNQVTYEISNQLKIKKLNWHFLYIPFLFDIYKVDKNIHKSVNILVT